MFISGVISPIIGVITIVALLITLLRTTHEPPSSLCMNRSSTGKTWGEG